MARDKNTVDLETGKTDKENEPVQGKLFRVNYTYAAPNGALRQGSLIVDAHTTLQATEKAEATLSASGTKHYRVTNAKPY